jgi:hypothetical protein
LISFSNGTVEKYDGQNAFNWISETLKRLYPNPSDPSPRQPQPPQPPQPPQQPQSKSQQPEMPYDDPGESDIQNHYQRQIQQRQELQSMQKNRSNQGQETSIDDLTLTEGGDQEEQPSLGHHIPQPPPPGSLPTSVDAAFRPDGSGDTGKAIKTSGQGNSVMAKAEQMQRMREQTEAPIAQNRGVPPRPPQ